MNEKQPRSIARVGQWTFDRLADQMQQTPELISDRQHGDGYSFAVKKVYRFLDLYPQAKTVDIHTPAVDIHFKDVKPPQPAKEGILLESFDGTARALFLRNGHIAVEVFPVPQNEDESAPRTAGIIENGEIIPSRRSGAPEASGDVAAASENTSRTYVHKPIFPSAADVARSTAEASAKAEEEAKRVRNLRGNVASEPKTIPTATGKPRVQFVLAEHVQTDGDEQTVYHQVYSLNKMAQTAIDRGIAKGQKVAVSGYRQEREHEDKGGKKQRQEVIYANQIRFVGQRREPAPQE